jgi:YebC/PmpR family DNA-binding regulatory protein
MSGHSKWASIRHKKGAADAKRGKVFTRIIREIMVAARLGGGDPSGNSRLRQAIAAAKAENMPKENIDRAIKKGTGELEGVHYEECIYEGYGPGGVAVLVEVMTDNKNRSAADLRNRFSKHGGSLGEAGCVSWMFKKKGLIVFDRDQASEDAIMEPAIEAGADDVISTDDQFEVHTSMESFEAVKQAFKAKGLPYNMAEVTMVPQNSVRLEGQKAIQMVKLMEVLEDSDDVQKVYANFDIADEILQRVS